MTRRPTKLADVDTADPAPSACGPRSRKFWTEKEPDPFDLWLQRSLHETFEAVAAEPIPENLLRLIEEDRVERERMRQRRMAKPKS